MIEVTEGDSKIDQYDDKLLYSACWWASMLSVIGCVTIILIFMKYHRLRKHFARLVIYLTIANFWFCVANMMGHFKENGTGCFAQGFMSTYFGLSSVMWTGAIAHSLGAVMSNAAKFNESKMESFLIKICFGVPFGCCILMLCFVRIKPAGFWCWIDDTPIGEIFRLLMFYIPLWSVVTYSFVTFSRVGQRLARLRSPTNGTLKYSSFSTVESEDSIESENYKAVARLQAFPLVLTVCWTGGSLMRIIGIFFPDFSWSLLNYITVITGSLQGFLNALLYGTTLSVREVLVDSLSAYVDHCYIEMKSWKEHKERRRVRLRFVTESDDGNKKMKKSTSRGSSRSSKVGDPSGISEQEKNIPGTHGPELKGKRSPALSNDSPSDTRAPDSESARQAADSSPTDLVSFSLPLLDLSPNARPRRTSMPSLLSPIAPSSLLELTEFGNVNSEPRPDLGKPKDTAVPPPSDCA